MPPLSIVFCGTPPFACPPLRALAHDPAFTVTHVITQPDRPVGRKQEITPSPIKILAGELSIPVLQPEHINTELNLSACDQRPDFLVVVAYGQMFSKKLLDWPRIAPINLHASLLPHLRGAAPVQYAILEGATETGVTVQEMKEKLDTGPILSQMRVSIDARETYASLSKRLSSEGAELLLQTLKQPLQSVDQREAEATYCQKLTKGMGVADVQRMTAEEIDRRIRALTPWPGVKMVWNGKDVILLESCLAPHPEACELSCAEGTLLYVISLRPANGKTMRGKEWQSQHHKK